MTNAERVQKMSVEELARFLNEVTTACSEDSNGCYHCPFCDGNGGGVCGNASIIKWLTKEADIVETD